MTNIVGAGISGCVLASLIPNSILWEKDKVGGLCQDCDNYQDFVHILHTNNDEVWDLFSKYTDIKPHRTILKAYVNGELKNQPPKKITKKVLKEQYNGYSKKMWQQDTPKEALSRIITSPDEYMFHEKYEGVPDFNKFFKNITRDVHLASGDIRDGMLEGQIILTGAIDEYFNYCYGKLPYRGMQSVHYESETGLDADFVSFSDEKVPFQRLVDYNRLGYEGNWIGVESACNAKHYPMRTDESEKLYKKYKTLADSKGIILAGRLGTYHYLNMDEVIEQAIEIARMINENINSSK